MAIRAASSTLVGISLESPNALRQSRKSCTPRVGSRSRPAAINCRAALSDRSGQSPPAVVATVISGSHTSASRSTISGGRGGSVTSSLIDAPTARLMRGRDHLRRHEACGDTVQPFRLATACDPNNDRSGKDRVGQPAKTRQRYRCICGQVFCLDDVALDDTAAGRRTLPIPGVQEAADFFVVLSLGTEHCINLVVEDRRAAFFAATLRKMYEGETLMVSTGFGTSNSEISSARDLPDAGSALRKAMRGVVSHTSMKCVWTHQRVCATRASSLG